MWRTTLRTLWLGLHLLLLVMLMLGYVLPVVDPRATELDPWHEHIVIGGSPSQRAAALAAHVHSLDPADASSALNSTVSRLTQKSDSVHVLSMAAHDGFTPLSLGIVG